MGVRRHRRPRYPGRPRVRRPCDPCSAVHRARDSVIALFAARAPRVDPLHTCRVVHDGYTVLLTPGVAQLAGGRVGLFDFDTRILSRYELLLGGQTPMPLESTGDGNRFHAHLVVPLPGGNAVGPRLPQDVVEVEIERLVGCGMEEHLTVVNHSEAPIATELSIALDADFVDLITVEDHPRSPAPVTVEWDEPLAALTFRCRASTQDHLFERALRVTITNADSTPGREACTIHFPVHLAPHGAWHATLGFASLVDGTWRDRLHADAPIVRERTTRRDEWRGVRTVMASSNELAAGAFERAAEDLLALRNWELDPAPDAWFPNAGVPSYT